MGLKGQNSTFSKHGHVAYQIERNHKCSTMVAYILPADPLGPVGGVNKSKLSFSNMFMLHIKLKGIKVKNQLFRNTVMLHIKLKGITNVATW